VSFFTGVDAIVKTVDVPGAVQTWNVRGMSFRVCHLGPCLSYSLISPNSKTDSRRRLFKALDSHKATEWKKVVLVFGEIDCRHHIISRLSGDVEKSAIEREVQVTTLRYFTVVNEIAALGFEPIVWGPVATTSIQGSKASAKTRRNWPILGSMELRNRVTAAFNDDMCRRCDEAGFTMITLFWELQKDWATNEYWYFDSAHLSSRAWELALPKFKHRSLL